VSPASDVLSLIDGDDFDVLFSPPEVLIEVSVGGVSGGGRAGGGGGGGGRGLDKEIIN